MHTARCEGISQHHARHPITHQTMLRAAELHRVHTAAGPGVHANLQELDPPRGGQTLRQVLLGSRVQLRTCQSGLFSVLRQLLLSFVHTEARTQTTCNIELLAGASSIGTRWSSESFSQKQKRLLETRTERAEAEAADWSQRHQLLPLLCVSLRGCKESVSFSVANHQHDSTSNRSQKKLWCTIQNQDQRHQRERSCPCQLRPCTVFCSIRAALAPVFTGQFRTFLQTWPKKWQSSSSATTVACARQVQTGLSFVVASLSKFHHLHSEWVK